MEHDLKRPILHLFRLELITYYNLYYHTHYITWYAIAHQATNLNGCLIVSWLLKLRHGWVIRSLLFHVNVITYRRPNPERHIYSIYHEIYTWSCCGYIISSQYEIML